VQQRWSLLRAALYGILLMLLVFGVHLLGIWAGTKEPDPWLNAIDVPLPSFVAHWIGYFALGPILFVVIAVIRNAFARKST
jgi:hypothetical protein